MATRTGNAGLDAAIAQWVADDPVIFGYLDDDLFKLSECRYGESGKIELDGQLWQGAAGRCDDVSYQFCDWLRELGFDAFVEEGAPELFGYQDRQENPPNGDYHVLAMVRVGGQIWSIDWTAAQYGYREFPLIQETDLGEEGGAVRVVPEARWRR